MLAPPSISALPLVGPTIQYIGDPETGLVHLAYCSCAVVHGEGYLDLRTAMVRGYQLCPHCRAAQTRSVRS